MFDMTIQKIEALNRNCKPKPDENIIDDLQITKEVMDSISELTIYKRGKDDCPFNRGNWIIDIRYPDGIIQAIKLPIEMSEEEVLKYTDALTSYLDSILVKNKC